MIRRIYIFILLGILIENAWHIWAWLGYSDDFLYYTLKPTLQSASCALLSLWWLLARLVPFKDKENESWLYVVAGTYFVFQCVDIADMYFNDNQRDSTIDYILFTALNIEYWFIFRRR